MNRELFRHIVIIWLAVVLLTIVSVPVLAQICITPTGLYPEDANTILGPYFPANLWDDIYDNGKPKFDRLLIPIVFDETISSELGLNSGVLYCFVCDKNVCGPINGEPGSESWYIISEDPSKMDGTNTFLSLGVLKSDISYYYVSDNCPAGIGAFGLPYIASQGIQPAALQTLLTPKFPQDYLSDLFIAQRASMDCLYAAMRFSSQEASAFSAMGFPLPVDEDIMFSFSKVVCSDGNDYYVPTDFRVASQQNYVLSGLNGKKLYFTGTVSNAFAGSGTSSEGFFSLQGTDGEGVDVYLHDYNVLGVQSKDLGEIDLNDFMNGSPKGMASPFAIQSSGEQTNGSIFTVNFHSKGNNCLTGGAVSSYSSSDPIFKILAEIISLKAASIAVRPLGESGADVENRSCCLNFDDKFPSVGGTVSTNGLLALPVAINRDAPSIDLGNSYGRCTFNGGQYRLTTAGSNSMFYVASMAICYRQFAMLGTTNFGVGTSVATPNENTGNYPSVHIQDGTFTTYSAEEFKNVIDVVAHGWYRDYTDLRLPIKTRIDGGTFNNCRVYACDASAEQGNMPVNTELKTLCRTEMEVAEPNQLGLASLDLSTSYPDYATSSLTPVSADGKYYVYPYLPGDCAERGNSYTHNYVSVIPLMGVKNLLTMGGDVEVFSNEADGTPRKNAFFFYTRLNDYTKNYASVTLAGLKATVGQAISLAGNNEFSEVKNTDRYTIEHGLYTMLSFKSNHWYTICPPYDVHNIYVVETLPDDSLADKGLTQADKGTDKYLRAQGEADGVLAQGIVTSLLPDILSGKGSGVYMDLLEICRKTLHLNPTLLVHYNPTLSGHDIYNANYYLYEQIEQEDKDYGFPGMWGVQSNINDYSQLWKYAEPVPTDDVYVDKEGNVRSSANTILMQRGKNYSLFLPAGTDDYWMGKYLIFEGYGPQQLDGKNQSKDYIMSKEGSDNNVFEFFSEQNPEEVVFMQGNASFANYTTTEETGRIFVPSTESSQHDFVRQEVGYMVKPWETMLVMSTENTENYSSLSALSAASAMRSVSANDTSLPLAASGTLLASGRSGIKMLSLVPQSVFVYSIDGTLLWSGELGQNQTKSLDAPMGVYVLKGLQQTIKLIVTE